MKLTDQEVQNYAKAFGLEGDDLRTQVESHLTKLAGAPETPAAPAAPVEPVAQLSNATDVQKALEDLKVEGLTSDQVKAFASALTPVIAPLAERAARGDRAYTDRFAEVRDGMILDAIKEFRLDPKDQEDWVKFYNANPELAASQLKKLAPNPVLILTYGSDDTDATGEHAGNGKAFAATEEAYLRMTGAEDPVGAGKAA